MLHKPTLVQPCSNLMFYNSEDLVTRLLQGCDKVRMLTTTSKDLVLVHTVQLKPMIKAQISGRVVTSGISDVAIASIYSEKTRLKKLLMMKMIIISIIIIMNKSKEMTVFSGWQKLTSAMKPRPEK